MPKHGGYTIIQLMARHKDALNYISDNFSKRIGVFSEGLGGFARYPFLQYKPGSLISWDGSKEP